MFRTANWIGGALIISQFAAFLAAYAYAFLLYFLGHLTQTGTSTHFIDDEVSYVLFSILMFVPFFVLCVLANRRRLSDVVCFDKHSKKLGFALVLMCLGFFLVGNIFSNLIYNLLDWVGHPPYQPQSFQPETPFELAAVLLSSACIPALTEEFAFRGVILGLLRPYGNRLAIVASAILFALMHGNFVQIPFAFVCGIALGYATVRSNSLWPAVIAHFINNAMSNVLDYLVRSMSQDNGDMVYLLYFLFLLVTGVAGLALVRFYNRSEYLAGLANEQGDRSQGRNAEGRLAVDTSVVTASQLARRGRVTIDDPNEHAAPLGERVSMIIASPTLIIFAVYCIYTALGYIV